MFKTHFLQENLCALQVFLCALISPPVCAFARARANVHSLERTLIVII